MHIYRPRPVSARALTSAAPAAPSHPLSSYHDAVLNLQRTAGNQATQRLVQRLKIYPRDAKQEDTDFSKTPTTVNLDTATYKELQDYRTRYSEQQIEKKAHPNYVFEAGDIDLIEQRISELEAKETTVLCYEGQSKIALPGQDISFGDVSSCMTLTLVLEDGTKLCSHEALQNRVPGGAVNKLKSMLNDDRAKGKKVAKVVSSGVSYFWNTDFSSIMDDSSKTTIESDTEGFKKSLSSVFDAKVEFENHDSGELKVTNDGKLA